MGEHCWIDGRCGGILFQKLEIGGELPAAQVRPCEALAGTGAAIEAVKVFTLIGLAADDFEMGLNDVRHVAKQKRRALLALDFDVQPDVAFAGSHRGGSGAGADLGADFISADRGEADGLENVKPINHPSYFGFPVNCFNDTPCRRWRDDVVTDAFHLHFWTREAGEVAPSQNSYAPHWKLLIEMKPPSESPPF